MKKTMIYHVGLLQRGRTAVFQFRRSVDFLDCEILDYAGERETTKAAARARLRAEWPAVLRQLRAEWPERDFRRIVVD